MIDANKTIDFIKLKLYIDYLYQNHIYDEGESNFHKNITSHVVKKYFDPLNLNKQSRILDLGCGPGYFLDEIKERNYTNYLGITLSEGDIKICKDKQHPVESYDLSFLSHKNGFYDESVDFIFLRHALEHSPFPIITLMEYNRVLTHGGKIYIEVPCPDCERKHEFNPNHYSILGQNQLLALLLRTGFSIDVFDTIEFNLNVGNDTDKTFKERYYCVIATKKFFIDIK